MLIDTEKRTFPVTSPYDGQTLEELEYNSPDEVESFLSQGCDLARKKPLEKWRRIEALEYASARLKRDIDCFAMLIAQEAGKPLRDARVEALRASEGLKHAANTLAMSHGREVPFDHVSSDRSASGSTVLEPIGLVVAISAFNHPLNLVVHQVAPAIAAGCPVIIKPSLDTPLSCRKLVDLLVESGISEEYCRVALVENDLSEKLVTDKRVAFLSFIGSARVGWSLRSKLAPGTRCSLEHGGVAPAIVLDDADFSLAAERLAIGAYYHAGQVCVSTQRIFVSKRNLDFFVEFFEKASLGLIVGDPRSDETQIGPLIRQKEADRVATWIEDALESGGKLLFRGKRLGPNLLGPSAVLNPSKNCRLAMEEVFGPVVVIFTYDTVEEAVAEANALPWAFQASVFSKSLTEVENVGRQLDASTVLVNEHTAFRVDSMPFSGWRESGLGQGGIEATFHEMCREKLTINVTNK
ncbi:aldehyde dehydrogenase family protein [Pelagicoccus sp. SDUM812003]|uniref:aldehyde dehydrogenase family protein n=1 Tax=Pelagicoccus sp. SDUM812003 TaxID=3041267 RepID=UPI00280DEB04|nr:aldehyde dehydrogenase family protein [Pelagicoccus sp. SDUM812003]MDQ8202204.1 aldehyde dehydrogenase family protein [Pelagicoccus sp. SDUM812003]